MKFYNLSLQINFFNAASFTIKLQTLSTLPHKIPIIPIWKLKLIYFLFTTY